MIRVADGIASMIAAGQSWTSIQAATGLLTRDHREDRQAQQAGRVTPVTRQKQILALSRDRTLRSTNAPPHRGVGGIDETEPFRGFSGYRRDYPQRADRWRFVAG